MDERLDWMYQGGMVAKQEADKRADAQLMGDKVVELPDVQEVSKVTPCCDVRVTRRAGMESVCACVFLKIW